MNPKQILRSLGGFFIFIITYSLYSFFCPLISLLGFDVYLSSMPLTAFCFGLGLAGFNLGNILVPVKWENISLLKNSVNYSLLLLLLVVELIALTVYLIAYQVPIFTTLGQFDRFEFFETINQVWVVLTMAISLTSCLIIYYFDEWNRKQFIFGILLIIYYIALQLSLGNRRDFLPILLFSTSYFLTKYHSKLNIKIIIIGTVLFIGSFWLVQQTFYSQHRYSCLYVYLWYFLGKNPCSLANKIILLDFDCFKC